MKNNKFVLSTIILMIGGMFTKILGFIIKIIYTRIIGEDAISLYMLVMPTYSLLMCIATFALQITISKLVAEGKNGIKIGINTLFIIFIINIFIIIFMIFSSDFIANYLLHEARCKYPLIACSLTLPFISISALIKGYFFGKQKVHPYAISNVLEQVIRLTIISLILPLLIKKGIIYAVLGLILLSIISEISSIIIFMFFLPKKFTIKKDYFKPDSLLIRDILNTSIPLVSSKIIGNIGFFFEPVILTNILINIGYSNTFVVRQYGIYNAYSIGLLTMPAFFINALCQAIIPEISKYRNNIAMVKRRIIQSLKFSFIIGFSSSIFILIFRNYLLSTIYNTTSGADFIKVLSPFFVLFYLEAPLASSLQALGKSKLTMKITLFGVLVKLLSLFALSFLHIEIYGLVISEIINIFVVVFLNFIAIKKLVFN